MQMLSNAGKYDWETWVIGILRSVNAGGANGVLSGLVSMGIDPAHFNLAAGLTHTLKMMGGMFVLSSIVGMFVFLQTHGAPDKITVTQTTTLTQTTETTKNPHDNKVAGDVKP